VDQVSIPVSKGSWDHIAEALRISPDEAKAKSFQLDGVVEVCDDPTIPQGTPFSLRLTRPNRRSDYLFSKVRAAVERGHALFVDVEDYVTARNARQDALR
jgi:hypothetical protein